MRNLFDQYDQPENKLTHALAVCLHEDATLLKQFLAWIGVSPPQTAKKLMIVEQSLPGNTPESEESAERDGLPDIVIHDNEKWCVLIESKVEASLTEDQMMRHARTMRRRGFERIDCVALTKPNVRVPKRVISANWSSLYAWLGTPKVKCEWAERLRTYLRVAEMKLSRSNYLTEGTLTEFDGFKFSEDNPYTYGEAKRLLKLAMEALRKDKRLDELGADREAPGRGAITGVGAPGVWDFLPLKDRSKGNAFTNFPHLTLAVYSDHLRPSLTIPNGVMRAVRQRLVALGPQGLAEINDAILKRARRLIKLGAEVQANAVQRHYRSQRSEPDLDAVMTFRLEVSLPHREKSVKYQPEWVQLLARLAKEKQSNIQFQYRVQIPWETKGLDSRKSLDLIVESWEALTPLLDALRGEGPEP